MADRAAGGGAGSFYRRRLLDVVPARQRRFSISQIEALSILENAALLDLPVPEFIRKTLEVLLEKSGSGENVKGTAVSGASTDVQEMPISGGVVERSPERLRYIRESASRRRRRAKPTTKKLTRTTKPH